MSDHPNTAKGPHRHNVCECGHHKEHHDAWGCNGLIWQSQEFSDECLCAGFERTPW